MSFKDFSHVYTSNLGEMQWVETCWNQEMDIFYELPGEMKGEIFGAGGWGWCIWSTFSRETWTSSFFLGLWSGGFLSMLRLHCASHAKTVPLWKKPRCSLSRATSMVSVSSCCFPKSWRRKLKVTPSAARCAEIAYPLSTLTWKSGDRNRTHQIVVPARGYTHCKGQTRTHVYTLPDHKANPLDDDTRDCCSGL